MLRSMRAICIAAVYALFQSVSAEPQSSTIQLREAYNAAVMGWLSEDNFTPFERKHGAHHVPSWDCNPRAKWKFPARDDIKTYDRLYRVLEKRELRYGGLFKDWGPDYNYSKGQVQGVWPEIMHMIGQRISENYGVEIELKRRHFASSHAVLEALDLGHDAPEDEQIDMTEPYFFLPAMDQHNRPRQEVWRAGCSIFGSNNDMIVRADSDIQSVEDLFSIDKDTAISVGVTSAGNFDVISPIVPRRSTEQVFNSDALIAQAVRNQQVTVGAMSGTFDESLKEGLRIFPTNFVSMHTSFFRMDRDTELMEWRSAANALPLLSFILLPAIFLCSAARVL